MPVQADTDNMMPIRRYLGIFEYMDIENICANVYQSMLNNRRQIEVVFGNCVVMRTERERLMVVIKQETKNGFSGFYRDGHFFEIKNRIVRELTPDEVVITMTDSILREWVDQVKGVGRYRQNRRPQECFIQ